MSVLQDIYVADSQHSPTGYVNQRYSKPSTAETPRRWGLPGSAGSPRSTWGRLPPC